MELKDLKYKLEHVSEEKLTIIDKICKFHPGLGTDIGYSYYIGGMKDSGDWHRFKMIDEPIEILRNFLYKLENPEPIKKLTEKELIDSQTFFKMENGTIISKYELDKLEEFKRNMEHKIFFGA